MNLRLGSVCSILLVAVFVRETVTFAQNAPEPRWKQLTHQSAALEKQEAQP